MSLAMTNRLSATNPAVPDGLAAASGSRSVLAAPISQFAGTVTKSTLGIAIACILLAFLMMITRRKAISQVIGFLAMENGLFFAATSATYGMPMVVELGILFDVLVGMLIFGVFFFHIRETFESLDIHHMEKLKER